MVETAEESQVSLIHDLRMEIASLSERLARLERPAPVAPAAAPAATPPPKTVEAGPGITEAELLAISAALAAYLGVRVHIRQIRRTRFFQEAVDASWRRPLVVLVADWAFVSLGIERCVLLAETDNQPSDRVALRVHP